MSAWGRTGRVTLDVYDIGEPEVDREILIDGRGVARAIRQTGSSRWFASWPGREFSPALPTRDAAVLWVLRRVDPALWRQERGEVFRVRTYKYARGWHAIDPEDGQCQGCLRDFPSTIARARKLATQRAALR